MDSQYFILVTIDGKFAAPDGTFTTDKSKAATVYWNSENNSIILTDKMLGPFNQERVCNNNGKNCNNNGTCKNLKCQCNSGWSGDDCSVQNTPSGGDTSNNSGMSTTTIIGIVVGVLAGISLLIFFIYILTKKERYGISSDTGKNRVEMNPLGTTPISSQTSSSPSSSSNKSKSNAAQGIDFGTPFSTPSLSTPVSLGTVAKPPSGGWKSSSTPIPLGTISKPPSGGWKS